MTKWEYIKSIDGETVEFSEIFKYHLNKKFTRTLIDSVTINEIKYYISEIIHCFYPFEPVRDIINSIDVDVDNGKLNIELYTYNKYMYSNEWNKEKLLKEMRRRKLERICQ